MRGERIDDSDHDSALFLSAAREAGATVISIGDGGNEMGMGTFRREILAGVPHGELICTAEAADLTLDGVSSGGAGALPPALPGIRTESSLTAPRQNCPPAAGGVDGCTKKAELTVDAPSETHLRILQSVHELTDETLKSRKQREKLLIFTETEGNGSCLGTFGFYLFSFS